MKESFTINRKMIDSFLPAVLFLLFSPILLRTNGKFSPSSFPPFFSYIIPHPSLIPPPPPLFSTPARLTLCAPSLFLGNCSPLARALLWSRLPSSCFLNPPAEWVSDWPRGRREEREEEVTLFYACTFVWMVGWPCINHPSLLRLLLFLLRFPYFIC